MCHLLARVLASGSAALKLRPLGEVCDHFQAAGLVNLSCTLCSVQVLSSEDNWPSTFSSQSDSQYGSPPRGWSEELDEHGHTLYVSDYTQEKVRRRDEL